MPKESPLHIAPFTSRAMENFFETLTRRIDKEYLKVLEEKVISTIGEGRQTKEEYISKIIKEYKSDRLVLVLGAGVSNEHGLPDWDTLLQKLLIDAMTSDEDNQKEKSLVLAKIFTKVFSLNPLIAARYLSEAYNKPKGTLSFERAVRDALYEEVDINKETELFKEIRQLCVAPGRSPNLDSIITYNYDDVLENYLSKLNVEIPIKPIYDVEMRLSSGELPIYHVHGFLPQKGNVTSKNRITLSENVYHQQYSDIYSWKNIVQINKFRDYTCLFIGVSLNDPNIRRLLDIAMLQRGKTDEYHYIIRKKYDDKKFKDLLDEILVKNKDLMNQKENANLRFDETVDNLINVMESFIEKDDLSFGIRTIWINEYSEIPDILNKIRRG